MTILEVLIAPHPVLKMVAKPVEEVNSDIRIQLDNMLETMYDQGNGIGLAAPQVGISNRIIVMDFDKRENGIGNPIYLINPEIINTSNELNIYNEGCLSFPEQYEDVERPKIVKIKYLDYDGKKQELEADGLMATCIQHEIDHLDGILFVDHLSNLKRNMVMRKLKKLVKTIG